MDVLSSPQPCAVGEATVQKKSDKVVLDSYVSILKGQKSCEEKSNDSGSHRIDPSKLELCDVIFDQDLPVVKFSMEDINIFSREEGLHQAVVIKFSYGFPHISEVRRIFASQFDVKGRCNIGQLEYRHFLIRFDNFDDYARFIGKSSSFIKSKGEEFLFRSFPWTFSFNPKEETSMAAIWISLPSLPPNLFAKRSLLSIASAIGKPIAVDKATHDRTRPSTARVKIIINLLDNLPKLVKLQFIDSSSGNSVEIEQRIVYDNLPNYCEYCKHQGHEDIVCRRKSDSKLDNLTGNSLGGIGNNVAKLQGDARDLLNKKRDDQLKIGHNPKSDKKDTGEKKNSVSKKLKAMWIQKIMPEPPMVDQIVNNVQSFLMCDSETYNPSAHDVASEAFACDASELQEASKKPEIHAAAKETFTSVGDPEVQEEASINFNDAGNQPLLVGETVSKDHKAHDSAKETYSSFSASGSQEVPNNIVDVRILDGEDEMKEHNVDAAIESYSAVVRDDAKTLSALACEDNSNEVQDAAKESDSAVDFSESQEATDMKSVSHNDAPDPQEEEAAAMKLSSAVDDAEPLESLESFVQIDQELPHPHAQETDQIIRVNAAAMNLSASVDAAEPLEVSPIVNDDGMHSGLVCNAVTNVPKCLSAAIDPVIAVEALEPQEDNNEQPVLACESLESFVQIVQELPHPNAQETDRNIRVNAAAIKKEKQPMISNVSLKYINMAVFKSSLTHSTHEQGTFSGVNLEVGQQNPIRMGESFKARINADQFCSTPSKIAETVLNQNKQSTEDNSILAVKSKPPVGISGGIIQSVKSYPIIPYTYIEQKDHEVFSIFNEQDKPSVLPNRKDLVIKSKLWDQRHCEYEEGWEDGSSDSSSSEEEDDNSLAIMFTEEKNASVIDLVKNTMENIHNDNADTHTFEEGEEEEMLLQCRKDAARKGDLSPMHSKTNKKGRQRDNSWDGRVTEERVIRRPPMRIAKLKQMNQRA